MLLYELIFEKTNLSKKKFFDQTGQRHTTNYRLNSWN